MKNKYNSNDSLFSLEYKIPYDKSSIQEHLEESQEEINFIKIKLTQAYEKLEQEIKSNTELEEQNDFFAKRAKDFQEKYLCEKKENIKLKETLEVILKNRKILQEEIEQHRENANKKVSDRDKLIDELQKELKTLNNKYTTLLNEFEQKSRLLREYSDRLRDESENEDHREAFFTNKIQILEQEIARITEQKYVQVNRLRHQLQLYQRNATPAKEIKEQKRQDRRRQFSRPAVPKKSAVAKFDTRVSQQSESDFNNNKENVHSLQLNIANSSFTESSIAKWKRPPSVKDASKEQNNQSAPITLISEDQQLTQYQLSRKRAEQQLCALEKIKRPSNEEREKIARLQRQIYHLDSDIAGLKRKIRRKY